MMFLKSLTIRFILGLTLVSLCFQCELVETCASCADPDFTVFAFDTTANGFSPQEIDSLYVIRFDRGVLDTPLDSSRILTRQNPLFISGDLFNSSTLDNDYVVVGVNQEFRFEITDLSYDVVVSNNNCSCDLIENKSLRVNGELVTLTDPFQAVILQK